ncbi:MULTISPECIES: hypothetical protein [Staphylococcus]|uniref:hypothetical protein n=1 Tax=Staphylococcus TaxID=1279 RepID=UPI000A54EB54|nr:MULTISPECIES: hypothetical protein [Staphylococcus]MBK3933355.1 hypothetical protein [Staphylococcus haemolyticus]MCH4443494.1 hypothetical protein [Staphylococcus haemolyticus]MDN7232171.1 hypothetical protein [Staphylococcus haemolyticus]MEB6265173.1 hypothetical protein [Staphylococcus haemolyticus]QQQ85548.1 hypothetical protein I5100_00360 [Staphylococcus haemolyticus]
MSQTDYQIKPDNIKGNSKETSSISKISYEIENANNKSLKKWQGYSMDGFMITPGSD